MWEGGGGGGGRGCVGEANELIEGLTAPGSRRGWLVWLVADGRCWFVSEKKVLLAGCWFVLTEKYCCLVADKPSEHGVDVLLPV
jgi:hypothetical protein